MSEQPVQAAGPTRPLSSLNLTADQEDIVGENVAALVAVNIYRQLRSAAVAQAEPVSSCAIIANCCSCSKS